MGGGWLLKIVFLVYHIVLLHSACICHVRVNFTDWLVLIGLLFVFHMIWIHYE